MFRLDFVNGVVSHDETYFSKRYPVFVFYSQFLCTLEIVWIIRNKKRAGFLDIGLYLLYIANRLGNAQTFL